MRNPDKNRILNAIKHIESEDVPFQENDPDITLANKILGKDFQLSLHAYELPVADYVELCRCMGIELIYFADIWRLGRKEKVDPDGRIHYVDGTMKTADSLKDIWFPNLDDTERRLEETLNEIDGIGFGLFCSNKHAPSIVSTAVGVQDYWMKCLLEPDFILEFQRIIHEYCLKELELYGKYKVEAINIGMNITMKSGPMCSKEILEQLHYPFIKEQIELAHTNNIMVRIHADGNVASVITDFIELGADALHPLEPCGGTQDIYEIKEQYGDKIALWGNIDVAGVLVNGTPEEVRADVEKHMDSLAVNGGYVVSSSHDCHKDIPLENFFALRDAVHEYKFKGDK